MNQDHDTDSAAYVEVCLWLPGGSGHKNRGWLLIKGWAFVDGGTTEAALAFEQFPSRLSLVSKFLVLKPVSRQDVCNVYEKAPENCGFSLTIPLEQAISHKRRPVLLFRRGQNTLTLKLKTILDASDPDSLCHRYALDKLRKDKLKNLLLNEAERLNGLIYKASKPISLYIDPSFACNLHCPHCVSEMLREQGLSKKNMRPDHIHKILEQYGVYLVRVTLALWGEPLLNKRFAEIVRLLKDYGIFCETSTNLSVPLTDQAIDEIISSGLDEIRLSIDGATQETYARYRVGGNLDLVLNNVRRLVAAKNRLDLVRPKLRWQYLLFPWNKQEKEAAERLAQECGVDEFYCFPGDLWNRPPSILPRQANDENIQLGKLGLTTIANMKQRAAMLEHNGCDFLDHTLAVHSDSMVFPCCYYPAPKDALGIWKDLEADPFNAPRIIQLRSFVQALRAEKVESGPSPCAGCGALSRGHVEDHLDFMTAFQLIITKY